MPNYDYKCKECGSTFEKFHSMSDETPVECKTCNSKNCDKIVSGGSGVIFKGPGFHDTDYRRK